MSVTELRELTDQELAEALSEAKEERFNLRFQIATNQLDNTARLTSVKKEIARILTVMRERELSASSAGADGGSPTAEVKENA